MDDNLFTYEVEVANILCDSKIDDDSEHEADDDMGFDPSDIAFTEWLGLKGDDEVELTDEESFDNEDEIIETYEDYKDDWIYEWNKNVPWVDEKLRTNTRVWTKASPVKHTCKPFNYKLDVWNGQHVAGWMMDIVMEETYPELTLLETNSIIKITSDEEYVAIKEDEYDDLERTSKDACRATFEAKNIDEYWWRIYKSGDLEVLES
ncbi:hypothetical protein Tco_0045594 [Tanacetum coccineum]